MTALDMDRVKVDPAVAFRLPAAVALRRKLLPFASTDGRVHVACIDPDDGATLQTAEKFLGSITPERADPESLGRALDRVYGDAATESRGKPRNSDPAETITLCDEVLHAALIRQASDIHFDAKPGGLLIRMRVDGVLITDREVSGTLALGLVNRIKVLAGLDIAEKRAPQDGGFKHRFARGTQSVDIRVASLPTKHGERLTLRLLALQTESLTLERLGMGEANLATFERAIALPHGMVLLTGPTGSGKSTTLYAAIRRLMGMEALNILTVEDPIEYEIAGVSQVEVDAADKVSFMKALRSVLRHDPDVVMIGEIRDAETADVAIKASLTGHLVFSTLHTNSALSVVTRMIDMGVEHYLIAATLRLAVAQRLVRKLCPHCRSSRDLSVPEAVAFGLPELAFRTVWQPTGCKYCGGHGYAGRVGLFELVPFNEAWTSAIAGGASESDLAVLQKNDGLKRLIDDGMTKLLAGDASPADVIAAVNEW